MRPLSLIPLAFVCMTFMVHEPARVPIAAPVVVSQRPLALFGLSEQRDSLVVREARKQGVPVWLALSISHAENWTGDSMAVNTYSGAVGLLQVHPVNFGRFPECGENIYNRQTNVCYGLTILRHCLSHTLADTLSCYGGAVSLKGRRAYNLDVNRKTRLEWLE